MVGDYHWLANCWGTLILSLFNLSVRIYVYLSAIFIAGWRHGVMVNGVGLMNEDNQH